MFMVSNLKDKKCSRIGLGISKALTAFTVNGKLPRPTGMQNKLQLFLFIHSWQTK